MDLDKKLPEVMKLYPDAKIKKIDYLGRKVIHGKDIVKGIKATNILVLKAKPINKAKGISQNTLLDLTDFIIKNEEQSTKNIIKASGSFLLSIIMLAGMHASATADETAAIRPNPVLTVA